MRRQFLVLAVIFSAFLMPSVSRAEDLEVSDPIEPVNRKIFWFNDKVDVNVLEPVATGYHDTVPNGVRQSVSNFFHNLRYPVYLVSDVVQFKFTQAAEHTGRFLVNSTIGLAGLFDVATCMGLKEKEEDFGIALAYHGVPPGPYIVLPFIGPSNLRDTVGFVVDSVLNPLYWAGSYGMSKDGETAVTYGGTALKVVDTRSDLLDAIKTAKESSVDYYLFMQGAYYQHRKGLLIDKEHPPEDPFADD